ncbi:MAG: hypothetical protein FJZ49_06225 [Candidatus Verstraetearchaeota archaeon]|nr:hypothetical protein [Candidatus Verstraetearchaeota archaeon]
MNGLLKWGLLALLLLLSLRFPWLLLPLGLYFAWRYGLLRRFRKVALDAAGMVDLRGRVLRWNLASCKELQERTVGYRYFVPCEDSPFALLKDGAGHRSVSAFVIQDTSGAATSHKRAVAEAVQLLSGGSNQVVLMLIFSKGGVGSKIQLIRPTLVAKGTGYEWIGSEVMEAARVLTEAVRSRSPTLRVRVCRGRDILRIPVLEGVEIG